MSFVFPTLLTIGLPLVALPLVIHLINLRRHRRVDWAAMDFLLESQKRSKNWILLQQLLLLLMRTAAVALVVLMLAGPVLQSQWGRFFGRGTTHHLFLLDDSYSMSDRSGETSAFEGAKRVIGVILDQATQQVEDQKLTLVRFSTAPKLSAGAMPEISRQDLNRSLLGDVQALLDEMRYAQSDAGPLETVQAALSLPEAEASEAQIVYLVSDFRRRQWTQDRQLRQSLGQLREKCDQLQLVQCVDASGQNLAITRLEPEAGIRAAGVETWFELTVANYGDQPAVSTAASLVQNGHRLPTVVFDEIPPGEAVTRRFRVTFPTAGAHQLQASLERDPVEVDNTRYFACQVPSAFPVLIVDGSPSRDDGFYLRTALDPGGLSGPGWSPQEEPASFLRKHDRLNEFAAICLLDVNQLDESEVDALEQYVREGGGLAVFLGPEVQRAFYNEHLYRDGEGLLPAPLDVPTQLINDSQREEPDVIVGDHPVFRIFGGQRNSFLPLIGIRFYYAIDPAWRPPTRGDVRVLARLRNGAPYVVEKQFGEGRVVVQFSKLSPKPTELGSWSNWSLNPVFPVYANELVGYLTAARRQFGQAVVGDEVGFEFPEAEYQSEVHATAPRIRSGEKELIYAQTDDGTYQVHLGKSDTSGIWQIDLQPREGKTETRFLAVNVALEEGDLQYLGREQLAQRLAGIDYHFSLASQMSGGNDQLAGFKLSDTLLLLLACALLVEQWFAYRASYHQRAN